MLFPKSKLNRKAYEKSLSVKLRLFSCRDYWTRTSDLAPPRRVPFWTYPALYQGLEPYCNNSVDFVVDFSLPNDLT